VAVQLRNTVRRQMGQVIRTYVVNAPTKTTRSSRVDGPTSSSSNSSTYMSSWIKPSTLSRAVSTRFLSSRSAMSRLDFFASASFFSCKVRKRCIDSFSWTCRSARCTKVSGVRGGGNGMVDP